MTIHVQANPGAAILPTNLARVLLQMLLRIRNDKFPKRSLLWRNWSERCLHWSNKTVENWSIHNTTARQSLLGTEFFHCGFCRRSKVPIDGDLPPPKTEPFLNQLHFPALIATPIGSVQGKITHSFSPFAIQKVYLLSSSTLSERLKRAPKKCNGSCLTCHARECPLNFRIDLFGVIGRNSFGRDIVTLLRLVHDREHSRVHASVHED